MIAISNTARLHPDDVYIDGSHFVCRITPLELQTRIAALAAALEAGLSAAVWQSEPVFMPVLTGALPFAGALLSHIWRPYTLVPVKVASYGAAMQPEGAPRLELQPKLPLAGRHVVVLEDIVDTGATADLLISELRAKGAASVSVCCLLFKPGNFGGAAKPDYVGFAIDDAFVVGFGLDFAEQGRWLPGIYQLKEE